MVRISITRDSKTIPSEKLVHPDSLQPGAPAKEVRWDSDYNVIDALDLPDLEVGKAAFIDWPEGVPWGYYETWRGERVYEVRLPETIHPAYVLRKR